jgi:REP element-mobilizing transposase RayT
MVLLRKFNPEIHHRRSIRFKGYDYSRPGFYFFTLNTKNGENWFGKIEKECVLLSLYGKILEATWQDLPNHNQNIVLDAFVIMPDHFHGIIQIIKPQEKKEESSDFNNSEDECFVGADPVPAPTKKKKTIKNHSLSEIIRQLKSFSSIRINEARGMTGIPVWQRDYYETIIRNRKQLERIRNYIRSNPLRHKL